MKTALSTERRLVVDPSDDSQSPGILDFLHEFRSQVFDGHDIFTVAEANGVAPEELPRWVGEDGVFSMLFEFSHSNVEFTDDEIGAKPLRGR